MERDHMTSNIVQLKMLHVGDVTSKVIIRRCVDRGVLEEYSKYPERLLRISF
jgi:hypothetical protein